MTEGHGRSAYLGALATGPLGSLINLDRAIGNVDDASDQDSPHEHSGPSPPRSILKASSLVDRDLDDQADFRADSEVSTVIARKVARTDHDGQVGFWGTVALVDHTRNIDRLLGPNVPAGEAMAASERRQSKAAKDRGMWRCPFGRLIDQQSVEKDDPDRSTRSHSEVSAIRS